MPDPILMLQSLAAALFVAATVVAVGRLLGRRWAGVVQAVAIGLGAGVGLAVLGVRPKWPMAEDQDRFLGLILPGTLIIEAILSGVKPPRWAAAGLRLLASMAVAPTLLYGSSYISDLAGPGTAEWPPMVRYPVLAGVGLTLFGVWWALAWTTRRSDSAFRAPFAAAGTVAGASLAVMLSGYATGGMNGLPIAGALAGASIAAAILKGDGRDALPGFGVVALVGLLLAGYGFGELKPDAAAALALAPLLAVVPEFRPLNRFRPWLRTAFGVALVALAVAGAVGLTAYRFSEATAAAPGSQGDGGISADDYSQFK